MNESCLPSYRLHMYLLLFINNIKNNSFHARLPKNSIASLVAQLVKNLPAMQEILVRFLGWEDALEKG